jgi:1-acyl-sn-glycerol-3-phosphate acyltransferase
VAPTRTEPGRRHELLYDAVALGMWAYTRAAFRVVTLHAERLRWQPGLVLVVSHRAETDVPLLCPTIYRYAGFLRERRERLHFVAREDIFERGFLAGFPAGLPLWARRALWPVRVGGVVSRMRMHPVPYPSAETTRLGRALALLPADVPLAGLLPPPLEEELRARARALRRPQPQTVADVRDGAYADLLWRVHGRDELTGPAFDAAWAARAGESLGALRSIVALVRSGASVLFFPEGRPSPDGRIGPLRPGFGRMIERGGPAVVQPLALAYDPITTGRPRAYLAFGPPLEPHPAGLDTAVLDALRRATPLTCGQVVARAFLHAATGASRVELTALERELRRSAEEAAADGRPFEQPLLETRVRRRRVEAAARWASRRGLARRVGDALVLAPAAVLADPLLRRAAAEHASAREPAAGRAAAQRSGVA